MQKIIAVLIGLVIVGGIAWYIREPEVVEEMATDVAESAEDIEDASNETC